MGLPWGWVVDPAEFADGFRYRAARAEARPLSKPRHLWSSPLQSPPLRLLPGRFLTFMASFDVIFLGGGPAGYVGAIRAAQLGLNVGVIEREGLGGTCVLWGCIPAQARLEAASLAEKVKKAKDFGIELGEAKLDYGVAMKRSRAVSTQNSK